ncbi:MAG: PEP-CTERM sorting domain-containing protein [Thermodesulfobacteriota bacterium]|nr:PEP-CTERM sorting domain-containing protein [Thermodesulfobacteriota bacterium]
MVMKKALLIGLSGMLLLFGTVSIAGATPITLIDTTIFTATGTNPNEDLVDYGWGEVNKLDGIGDYVVWTHHYDFIPAVQTVLSGNLSVYLRDEDDGGFWDSCEFAFGWAEDGTWGLGEVDTGIYSYDVTAKFLYDGEFTITLVSLWGDFYIDQSELEITYEPVPEPATMLLFGVGLVGLAGIHRKKRA